MPAPIDGALAGPAGRGNEGWGTIELLRDDGLTRLTRVEIQGEQRLVKRRAGPPSLAKAVALHTDYETATGHGLRCALTFERRAGAGQDAVLYFLDPGGVPFDRLGRRTVAETLDHAMATLDALAELHRAGFLHRDLRPDTLMACATGVRILDFGHAVRLRRQHPDLGVLTQPLERLRYMAPELTGRLNCPVDYRADLYSFGAVLYERLTGAPPFTSTDPHELVYHHLALPAARPRGVDGELPEAVICLVMRLLEKDPNRRYQDTDELHAHLELARAVVRGERADSAELLGAPTSRRPLDVAHHLYGRETERRTLLDCLESAFAGRPQLLLIGGESGVGKTTLIRETYRPVTRESAFYVAGKFDQIGRATPYQGWVSALESLAAFLLAEPAGALAIWRERLTTALGDHAAVLCELVPIYRQLLDRPPAPAARPPSEAREQVREAFLRFFELFSRVDRPVVLFLDDLQWIDSASLELLETLVARMPAVSLLIIGAYRDNEVPATHPLRLSLRSLRASRRTRVTELTLHPLREPDVVQLLADGIRRPPGAVGELARELTHRTGGNPFFVWQFLRILREVECLYIDPVRQCWTWDLSAIGTVGFADNVVDLMLQRFGTLPEACRQRLSWAACVGTRFDIELLAWLGGDEPATVYCTLQPALDEEFIVPLGAAELDGERVLVRRFRFFHDRMQEVAYQAIAEADRPALHHRIATLLRERLPAPEQAERVIEIAGHLNLARERLTTSVARVDLARLNLEAARRARDAAAFEAGVAHLRIGMAHLPDDIWSRDPDLAYALYRHRGELEYLNGEVQTAQAFVNEAIDHEQDLYRRVDLYDMLVVQHTLQAHYQEAVATAREGLALLDAPLPEADPEAARDEELAAVRRLLDGRRLDALGDLPAMSDRRWRAVMQLLTSLGPPCYRAHPRLWSVIVARQTRLCLEHGTVAAAVYTYPAFGGLLTHVGTGDGCDAAQLEHATRGLMARFDAPATSSVGHLMVGSSLRHWFMPMRAASEDYLAAYRSGQAGGNLQYAVYGFAHDTYCRYFRGDALTDLIPEALGYLDYSRQRGNLWAVDLITGALRVFEQLHGGWETDDWPGREEAESEFLARCADHGNVQVLCIYHIMRASALLLQGEAGEATASIREAEQRLDSVSVQGLLPATQFPALKALALAAAPDAAATSDAAVDRALAAARRRYAQWRVSAPANFACWHELMVAEEARRAGDTDTVITAYDRALAAAEEQSVWPAVGLIARRAAEYWDQRGHGAFAGVYHEQAGRALASLCHGETAAPAAGEAAMDEGAERRHADMGTVIRIAQALSLHTRLDELVPAIIHSVAQHTGAQRVVLLLARGDALRVAMERTVHSATYHAFPPDLDTVSALPRSVIRYVARSQRTLRFGRADMAATPLLGGDPYLNPPEHGASGFRGSVWCVPLTYLGDLLGVLYLENGLTEQAFDATQAPLVEFLAAQAAISVRNIELMNQVVDEGRARRAAESRVNSADAELMVRREEEERLERLANTDVLTGLANRRLFMQQLSAAWSGAAAPNAPPMAVAILDIDHFKAINDTWGHPVGDGVLSHLANVFQQELRAGDLGARIGGEEFALLLSDSDGERARRVASRLRRRIAETPAVVDGRSITFTVSVGITAVRGDEPSPEALLDRADRALYRAKRHGRNRVEAEIQA